jgi:hypothetical protein
MQIEDRHTDAQYCYENHTDLDNRRSLKLLKWKKYYVFWEIERKWITHVLLLWIENGRNTLENNLAIS